MKDVLKKYLVPLLLAITGVGLLLSTVLLKNMAYDAESVANRVEKRIERRVKVLDSFAQQMLQADPTTWTTLRNLPSDMVVYRYVCDTLQCWGNQFPVLNDDIRNKIRFQWINRPETSMNSPLNDIQEELSFVSLGSHWYLAKWMAKGELTEVIAAIEICTSYQEGELETVNKKLGIPQDLLILPIAGNPGATVKYGDKALFTLISNGVSHSYSEACTWMRWLALLAICAAALSLLYVSRRWREFIICIIMLIGCYGIASLWGLQMEGSSTLFSPATYAGKGLWWSFGALGLLNLLIFNLVASIFMMRHHMVECESRRAQISHTAVLILMFIGIIVYTVFSVYDLMSNSSITLELRWFQRGILRTLLAQLFYGLLLASLMMLLYMLSTSIKKLIRVRLRFMSIASLSLGALIFSAMLFGISAKMGFDKECSRVNVWANRLSVDRNLTLEMQILMVEDAIAHDEIIPVFADLQEASGMINRQVSTNYFANIESDYDVVVSVCNNDDEECNAYFNSKLLGGTQVGPGSRFVCNYDNNGRSSYAGTYMYRSKNGLLVRMLVEILSRASKEDNGYYSIFDRGGNPGDVVMPEYYSHAKYKDGVLASYKGNVAYPTILSEPYASQIAAEKTFFRTDGYIHFLRKVSEEETMIISRRNRSSLASVTAFLSIFAIMFLILTPLLRYSRSKEKEKKKNFKRQIRWALTGIVASALAILAFVSVKFVFDRNRIDSMNVMSEKISAIQTIMESRTQGIEHLSQVDKTEWMNLLQNVASTTKSDLSLFTPKGNVYLSTVAEMYELNLLDFRLDGEVYNTLVNNHQRICIHKEETDGKRYYALYAPILSKSGSILAIVSTPFNRDGELMREALPHAILLIILLLAIIIITSTIASQIIARIFEPLSKVTKVMDAAGTEGLETIEYSGEDEISTLVDAYNRMVEVIDESNKVLAQNERDKAWSAMARQVAHEIKNPLTPMNLEIQKLILMKQRGNPLWIEKFDESARIILEHINILTATANEFSTFAKLYTEDPVEIDLNQMLEDQISFFSNKENIEITYLGFKEAVIMGPKPQLIRVFVNLLTNATQAIENADGNGQIRVELRNNEDCYEISVEDSGPGVPEENIDKLFTPNFTTKNSGTGLGLAISRNIVEKCNGSIGYKKSFNLNGACFTVRLPKTQTNA